MLNQKKVNLSALIITALGIFALFIIAVFFQYYTYGADGKIEGDWRAGETMMYLGTARFLSHIAAGVIAVGLLLFLISHEKITRKQSIMGVLFAVLGTLAIYGTLNSFYPCTEMMRMNNRPMRCYWTMKTLLGVAGTISITGVLMLFFGKSRELLKGLNYSVILLGCLHLLIPLKMTGFCLSVMLCVEVYRPFLIMMSCLILALSVLNIFLLKGKSNR
ncbi:MAG: DUF4418 family protein [Treponema sp.]|nr:DUF4418 family protein [Treponema sp.]MCL2271308.1 DUF4418 family protein [Treponema sp.]